MKNMNLKEKGITIISLVVTIIILLILAGVSIRVVSGDNGLFRKAKEVVDESKKAEYQEGLTTIGLGIKLEKSSEKISSKEYIDLYEEEMNKQIVGDSIFKGSKVRRKNDETLRVETKEGYIYYIKEDETIYIGKAGEVDESEMPDIGVGDIKFKYSTEEWTNEDVTVEITIGEEVENKENYVIEYSKDAKNWTRYIEPITMTTNGEIYARAKDKLGDIKVEKYATGEVQNIDKNAPTPGKIVMKMASSKATYEEGVEVYQNVTIELEEGADNEGESGHKATTCTITGLTGITSISKEQGSVLLKARDENYVVTAQITTSDIAGNTTTVEKEYTIRTIYAKETKELTTSDGTYYLPEGFKLAEDSATKISDGIVVEDKNENQWVWVPCYVDGGVGASDAIAKKLIKYDRYAISSEVYNATKLTSQHSDGSYYISFNSGSSYYYEGISTTDNDYKSIKEYGGYFIGRYEAGKNNGKLVVQKDKETYTNITVAECHSLSNGMISDSASKVYTKLCSSYAWDTALMFIQKTHLEYGKNAKTKDNILAGQYNNNLYGIGKLKTGQTLPVCNIYDMGGNVDEYTSELRTANGSEHILRGGRYEAQATPCAESPGSRYGYGAGPQNNERFGFRVTLYIKSNT